MYHIKNKKNIKYLTPYYEIDGTQNNINVTCNIICLGITENQRETFENTVSKIDREGFTMETQLDSQQGQEPIKGNH